MPLQNAPSPPYAAARTGEPLALGDTFEGLVDKLGDWLEAAILALPNFVVALVIVVVAALLALKAAFDPNGGLALADALKPALNARVNGA